MKAKLSQFRSTLREHFNQHFESVNRARRGEEDDYKDEPEGSGTQYESVDGLEESPDESVDRLRRADDGHGETEFEEGLEESNLYTDADQGGPSEKSPDCGDDEDEDAKSHAAPSGEKNPLFGESFKLPSLKSVMEAFMSDKDLEDSDDDSEDEEDQ